MNFCDVSRTGLGLLVVIIRLSGIVEALPARVAQAEAAPLAHLEFLELLVEDELARSRRVLNRSAIMPQV